MKPSANTVMNECLVRPLLNRLIGFVITRVQQARVRRQEARIAEVRGWMDRECEYHDEHLLALDTELTMRQRRLHEMRMAQRLANVKREAKERIAA